jgi:hypothetical protein
MPGGRPPKLDQVVDRRQDGSPVTASQKVVDLTRTVWAPWDVVAAHAGVTRDTLLAWRKKGGEARAKAMRGQRLTPSERRYAEFLGDLEKAEGDAVAARLGLIQKEGQGGYPITTTTESTRQVLNKQGEVVTLTERKVVTTTARGEWQAEAWQLERRRPADFGRRVELVGAGGEPLVPKAERADALAEALEAYQRGLADGTARAKEVVDGVGPAARTEENGSPHG